MVLCTKLADVSRCDTGLLPFQDGDRQYDIFTTEFQKCYLFNSLGTKSRRRLSLVDYKFLLSKTLPYLIFEGSLDQLINEVIFIFVRNEAQFVIKCYRWYAKSNCTKNVLILYDRRYIEKIFTQLEEFRAFELLRSGLDRSKYLLVKEAKVIAMTCTHAALKRKELVDLGENITPLCSVIRF